MTGQAPFECLRLGIEILHFALGQHMQIPVRPLLGLLTARIPLNGIRIGSRVELPRQRSVAGTPLVAKVRHQRRRASCRMHAIVLLQPVGMRIQVLDQHGGLPFGRRRCKPLRLPGIM